MSEYIQHNGLWFHPETKLQVQRILAEAYENRATLRVWYGDTKTGKAWAEEYDIMGQIGRSCGRVKVPLLVAPGEDGAPAMLEHCIVRIDRVTRNTKGPGKKGATLYVHPAFSAGTWTTGPARDEGYKEAAYQNGVLTAQFKRAGSAQSYCDFMQGTAYSTAYH